MTKPDTRLIQALLFLIAAQTCDYTPMAVTFCVFGAVCATDAIRVFIFGKRRTIDEL